MSSLATLHTHLLDCTHITLVITASKPSPACQAWHLLGGKRERKDKLLWPGSGWEAVLSLCRTAEVELPWQVPGQETVPVVGALGSLTRGTWRARRDSSAASISNARG